MNNIDEKEQLLVHIIPGASDFAKIKMEKNTRVGKIGEPFTELTKNDMDNDVPRSRKWCSKCLIYTKYIQTSVSDYEKLCSTDILHLEEKHYNHDKFVFEKFKKQQNKSKKGWYEIGLIWRENNILLRNDKFGSLGKLKSLLKNLDQKQEVREAHDSVIKYH